MSRRKDALDGPAWALNITSSPNDEYDTGIANRTRRPKNFVMDNKEDDAESSSDNEQGPIVTISTRSSYCVLCFALLFEQFLT